MSDDLEAALRRAMKPADAPGEDAILGRLERVSLPAQTRPLIRWPAALTDWAFAPAWPRIAALAAAAVLGMTIGLSGLGTRLASDLDLARVAANDDIPSNIFDLDAGLRP